jgi:hypothetical protein
MAAPLNPGFSNNINVMQLRSSGSSLQRVTDRTIGAIVSLGTWPPSPPGVARSVIKTTVETDGGVTHDNQTTVEFTEGGL